MSTQCVSNHSQVSITLNNPGLPSDTFMPDHKIGQIIPLKYGGIITDSAMLQ